MVDIFFFLGKLKKLFNETNEKSDDATSERQGENKTVEWRIYTAEGHSCCGEIQRQELDPPAVFFFQWNAAEVESKGGGGVFLPFALQGYETIHMRFSVTL